MGKQTSKRINANIEEAEKSTNDLSSFHSPISCNEKIVCTSKRLISIEKVPRIENPERIGRLDSHEFVRRMFVNMT